MPRTRVGPRSWHLITISAALALSATACARSDTSPPEPAPSTSDVPGRVDIRAGDVDLTISHATATLDSAGNGTLTMVVHNGSGVPDHLDMVATPDGGRGALTGAAKGTGTMTDAGILIPPGGTVTFGGTGPTVRLTHTRGITAGRTLPTNLEFGVARLVHLTAVVTAS
ncbi:Copper(I)-binding protein [Actinacidiphila alni]|uniref:Copper(I)-binding protein n=1 Tax=Actinacidiphila alni TaxID=380248 RepID=A0A1I2HQE6_9ACTN|nr:copper chaperone PCu(A)C [Actinacidiphila alni]SFF32069.1 Copper(I)-binding protein [Actinacidiphila alni]